MTDLLEELCVKIQTWPQRRVSPYLQTLLQHTKIYQKNLLHLVWEVYFWADNPDGLRKSLTALSDAGELYCARRRRTLDDMCEAIQKNDLIHPISFPSRMDISQDIQINYDEEKNVCELKCLDCFPSRASGMSIFQVKFVMRSRFFLKITSKNTVNGFGCLRPSFCLSIIMVIQTQVIGITVTMTTRSIP